MPWLLSSAGYGVLIENTELSYFRLGTDSPQAWSLEVEARRLALPGLRRSRARRRRPPPDPLHRPPAGDRRPLVPRPLVPAGRRRHARRGGDAARGRRTRLDRQHLPALPALWRPGRQDRRGPRDRRRLPRARLRGHHLLQPDGLQRLPAGLQRSRCGRRAGQESPGRSLHLPLHLGRGTRPRVHGRPVRLLRARRRRLLRQPPRRGGRRRLRRLDGGLRRVHTARLGLRQRDERRSDAQPLPRPLPPLLLSLRADPEAACGGLHPLGLDRRASLRAARLGRRPDPGLGLRRARVGGLPGPQPRHVRNHAAGARRSAASSRSAATTGRRSCCSAGSSSAP